MIFVSGDQWSLVDYGNAVYNGKCGDLEFWDHIAIIKNNITGKYYGGVYTTDSEGEWSLGVFPWVMFSTWARAYDYLHD